MARKQKRPKQKVVQARQIPQTPEEKQKVHAIAHARAVAFSGPLPPPEILDKYNQTLPGAAERIIAMAESQSKHRQQLESDVINSDIRSARLGLHYGLIIGLTTVIGSVICISIGYEIGGTILGGTGLTGLVGVFVYGSTQRRKEREKRFDLVTTPKQQ